MDRSALRTVRSLRRLYLIGGKRSRSSKDFFIDPEMAASLISVRCGAAHLSSRESVQSRPLVAANLAGCRSRNVRISCTFMPYHHKAPQQEQAKLASRIVELEWLRTRERRKRSAVEANYRLPPRDTGAARPRTRAPSPAPLLTSRYYLLRYYQ